MTTNPLAIWADLWSAGLKAAANTVRAGEMMRDSAAVIARRTPLIDAACRNPAEADLVELGRMVTEKQDAWREATLAVAGDVARLQRQAARQWSQLARASADLGAATAMLGTAASATDRALRPFHRRARANARRLGRR